MSSEHGGSGSRPAQAVDPWVAAQRSTEFVQLRRKLYGFVFPMTALFLVWYFVYVALAAFAPGFMAVRVGGNINIGLVIGLLQFVSTFLIATAYVRYASRNLDPVGRRIRERVEGGAQ